MHENHVAAARAWPRQNQLHCWSGHIQFTWQPSLRFQGSLAYPTWGSPRAVGKVRNAGSVPLGLYPSILGASPFSACAVLFWRRRYSDDPALVASLFFFTNMPQGQHSSDSSSQKGANFSGASTYVKMTSTGRFS